MKKILVLLSAIIITAGISTNVFAGEYDVNEQYVIEQISSKDFPVEIEQQYINQLKNYFCQDEVNLDKTEAEDFVAYLKDALVEKNQMDKKGASFDEKSSVYQNFQKAGKTIGLLLEYDSNVNDFYAIDESGFIVIDGQKIIKNTDTSQDTNEDWNISIEAIFAAIIVICILGIVANLKRWNKKLKRRSSKNYDDDEEDELEVANRKTRKARLQTLSYKSVKQILKYFYVPIIMGLIVIGAGFIVMNMYSDITDSVNVSFINTQPLYNGSETEFIPATMKASEQDKTIGLSTITFPKYGEQYGVLQCKRLNVDAPVYFGDRGNLLKKGAGNYIGSSIPGQGGTILIGAHDTTYFEGLENVKKGDKFTFTTGYGIYTYKVTDTEIYGEDDYDKAYDLNADKEQLVLYTCYPFGVLNGIKTERMFVYLDKVNGPDIVY